MTPGPTSSTHKSNTRLARGPVSKVTPIIGSISVADVPQNVSSVSEKDNEEVVTKVSKYKRVRSRSCQKAEILEEVPNQEHSLGKVLITVISQTPTPTSSEVDEEDESHIRPVTRSSRKSGEKDKQGMKSSDKMLGLERKRKREDGSKTSRRNSPYTKPQEEEGLHADLASCMKRQLRVIIPRLDMKDSTLPVLLINTSSEEHTTMSPRQPSIMGLSAARNVDAVNRKRRLSLSETPEKNLTSSIDKQ